MERDIRQPANVSEAVASPDRSIRVVAMMEATSVTGPAKNVIEFATRTATRSTAQGRVDLSIIAFVRGDAHRNVFVSAARSAGVPVDVVDERFAFDIRVISQLRKIISRRNPDIIQTHAVKSHFLVWLTGLRGSRRWIAFNRGYTRENLKVRAYNQLDRLSLRKADLVITVCTAFARDLQRKGVRSDRIVVQHNMALPFTRSSPNQVTELRKTLGIPLNALVLLCVGRLSPEKGHSNLIDAVSQLREVPAFHLVIVGEGQEHRALARKIEEMGLGRLATLTGHESNLDAYYSMADIFILPSHSEGSPNVLLEAMAAAIPTVATKVGGVPDITTDGRTSLLVPSKNPTAIAKALKRLLNDQQLRQELGEAGVQHAAQYDPAHYCDSMVETHRRLLQGGR